jgi:hypothetical protein
VSNRLHSAASQVGPWVLSQMCSGCRLPKKSRVVK